VLVSQKTTSSSYFDIAGKIDYGGFDGAPVVINKIFDLEL
jgi:hypothetical protein